MGGFVKIDDWMYGCGTVKPDLFALNALTGQLTDSLRIGSGLLLLLITGCILYTKRRYDASEL